jgi:hypothetical protein
MSDVSDVRRRSLEEKRRWSMWGSGEPRRGMCRQMAENLLEMRTEERYSLKDEVNRSPVTLRFRRAPCNGGIDG